MFAVLHKEHEGIQGDLNLRKFSTFINGIDCSVTNIQLHKH